MSDAAVLRVLNGRLAGTARALPAAGTVSIGHQYWQDVVIRDPNTKGMAVDLTTTADGSQAQISVLSGEALLLGQTIEPGGTAILPPFVPFSIGGVSLAWGEADSPRWSEAGSLVVASDAPALPGPDPRDEMRAALERARQGASGLITPRNIGIAAVAILALVAAFAAMPVIDALGLRPDKVQRVQRALADAGLPALTVTRRPDDDSITVTGIVQGERERNRASAALRDAGVEGTINLQTSAELAQSAAEVARGRGLQAQARALGRTRVELHTSALTDAARAQLTSALKSDVHGATRVTLIDDLPSPDDVPIKVLSDLTRKVSNIVTGDPSFIQTVDGARYFSGALMPSGHRLLGIEGHTVYLEKSGRRIKAEF